MEILQLTVLSLAGVAAAALLPVLALAVYRRVEAGLALLALLVVLDMCLRESLALKLGISVYPADAAYLLVALVGAARIVLVRPSVAVSGLWLAFGAVLALSFVLGTAQYGTAAGVQFRGYFYSWTAAFYAMSFRFEPRLLRRTLSIFVWLGAWVQLATLLGWFSLATGVAVLAPNLDADTTETLRVVRASEALLLADAIMLSLCFARLGGAMRLLRPFNLLWIPSLLLLQHRSVWVAALGGVATALGLRRGERVRVNPTQAAIGAALAAGVLVAVMLSGRGAESVASAVGESARRGVMLEDTAAWRLNGWRQLLDKWSSAGPEVLAVGFPFGSDMTRYERQGGTLMRIKVAAHNAYVQTLYNSGLVGLGLFLAFAAQLAWSLLKLSANPECRDDCRALLAVLACQLLFYIPYGVAPLQMFFMGVGFAYAAAHRRPQPIPIDASAPSFADVSPR